MTHATKRARRLAPLPAATLAALLLAGCSTAHIGESWQCPLAETGSCDSVAAADPAVPVPGASDGTALREPLWRVRGVEAAPEPSCAADCNGGFDPFGWLARLFGGPGPSAAAGGAGDGDRTGHEDTAAAAGAAAESPSAPGEAMRETEAQVSPPAPEEPASGAAEAAAAAFPAPGSREPVPASEPGGQARGSSQVEPAQNEADVDDLRTGEILARVWIAPFVDGNGVYREASHVRVVLEPAGWRLP